MSSLLFFYVPTNGIRKACNTPTNPIVINSTNVSFSDVIPIKHRKKGLEAFVEFLKSHLLRYALDEICSWWHCWFVLAQTHLWVLLIMHIGWSCWYHSRKHWRWTACNSSLCSSSYECTLTFKFGYLLITSFWEIMQESYYEFGL